MNEKTKGKSIKSLIPNTPATLAAGARRKIRKISTCERERETAAPRSHPLSLFLKPTLPTWSRSVLLPHSVLPSLPSSSLPPTLPVPGGALPDLSLQIRALLSISSQPEQTVPPSGHTRPWAVTIHMTKTNTRGGLEGHRQTFTGDPNFRFEPKSPEVTVKKMPKLKC